ncbi:hypothetical protein D3C87_1739460 [compost metagenome]
MTHGFDFVVVGDGDEFDWSFAIAAARHLQAILFTLYVFNMNLFAGFKNALDQLSSRTADFHASLFQPFLIVLILAHDRFITRRIEVAAIGFSEPLRLQHHCV